MEFKEILVVTGEVIGVILALAGLIALVLVATRRNVDKEVQKNQDTLIQTLKDRLDIVESENKELKKSHIDNARSIGDLQGQIKVLRDIPLKEIAVSMAKVAESQEHIIKLLKDNGFHKEGAAS